jgi:MFS family permease
MVLVYWGVPPGHGSFLLYFFLTVTFGLVGTWAQSGTNYPVLSHIVPASSRSRVMAWEGALENSVANAAGPMLTAILAEDVFGYKFGSHKGDDLDIPAATALGSAMAFSIALPWSVCFVAYSLLHWTYPRDIRLLEREEQKAEEQKAGKEVGEKQKATGVAEPQPETRVVIES